MINDDLAALVNEREGFPLIYGRTAGQQSARLCRATVVLQRAEFGVNWRRGSADLVAVRSGGDP